MSDRKSVMGDESLKTVERTLALLKSFERAMPELTVSDLMDRLAMPRSVVVRMLATLEKAEFVERVPGNPRLFRIGLGAGEVGSLYFLDHPLMRGAEDVLRGLAERTGFTAYLGTIHGAEAVILALREGRMPVRFIWQAGQRLPVATTSFGKAMLMHMEREQVDQTLGSGPLAGLTEGSVRTRADLDAQLACWAGRGWVPAFEESFPGVYAVGAALLDPAGAPVAGISLSFLRNPADPDQVEVMGSAVLEAARTISRRLGLCHAYGDHRLGRFASPPEAIPRQPAPVASA
jgi:DNA-binding IclR family transcriptional regulator